MLVGLPDFEAQAEKHPFYDVPRPDVRYIPISGKVEKLTRNTETGLWEDEFKTIWALAETDPSDDQVVRCGVGFFSFSTKNPLTAFCGVHDYLYTSPTFQYFHTRLEADKWLYEAILSSPSYYRILARPMYWATRIFGNNFWESKEDIIRKATAIQVSLTKYAYKETAYA